MTLLKETLEKYKGDSKIFIECGSAFGDGIQTALDCGFEQVYSCEPNLEVLKECFERFKYDVRVKLFHQTSVDFLEEMFDLDEGLKDRCVIWLDSHVNGKKDKVYGKTGCNIIDELEVILELSEVDQTILIDDIRLFKKARGIWGGVTLDKILEVLEAYNRKDIEFADGFKKDDILVVKVVK